MGEIVTVNFRGDELYGFKQANGVFVALKPIVEVMGMAWGSQYNRLMRDPVLAKGIFVMKIPFGRGGAQEAVCLNVELVQGWLFTIDSSRIKDEEVRARVQMYQRECYGVLHAHFTGKAQSAPASDVDPDVMPSVSEQLRLVTESRQTFGIHASRQMWFKQGLPVVPAMLQPEQGNLFGPASERDAA